MEHQPFRPTPYLAKVLCTFIAIFIAVMLIAATLTCAHGNEQLTCYPETKDPVDMPACSYGQAASPLEAAQASWEIFNSENVDAFNALKSIEHISCLNHKFKVPLSDIEPSLTMDILTELKNTAKGIRANDILIKANDPLAGITEADIKSIPALFWGSDKNMTDYGITLPDLGIALTTLAARDQEYLHQEAQETLSYTKEGMQKKLSLIKQQACAAQKTLHYSNATLALILDEANAQ